MTSGPEPTRDLWNTLQLGGVATDFSMPTVPFDLDVGYGPVRLGRSHDGNPCLLIPCGEPRNVLESIRCAGIDVRTISYVVSGRSAAFIELQCRFVELREVFLSLADDMLRRLAGGIGPERAVVQSIEEYRDLLEPDRGGSLQSVVGLFGELTFLEMLQAHNPDAALTWTGPFKQRNDFSGRLACVEVKSTLQRDAALIHVSSLDQLEPPEDGRPLYLVVQGLERTGTGGRSTREVIESVRKRANSPERIDEALAQLDLRNWRESRMLASERFWVRHRRIFAVKAGFPRIGPNSFQPGLPPVGVSAVSYDLDLRHAEVFRIGEPEIPEVLSRLASKG